MNIEFKNGENFKNQALQNMNGVENRELSYELLLLAHVICANGQIHSEELDFLNTTAHELNLDTKIAENTFDAIERIFLQEETLINFRQALNGVDSSLRSQVFQYAVHITKIDRFISTEEKDILIEIARSWGYAQQELFCISDEIISFNSHQADLLRQNLYKDSSTNLSYGQRAKKIFLGFLGKVESLVPKNTAQEIESFRNRLLLSGPEYLQAIRQCTLVGVEDYIIAERSLKVSIEELSRLKNSFDISTNRVSFNRNLPNQGSTAQEVAEKLALTKRHLIKDISEDLEELEQSFHAKQRALSYFSIAFMGKTKAGKSTLHAVVTGEGWNAIGAGKQRTTRYNRIYQWENLRIIDTPGIGAAEDGGRRDEQITKGIIDEADIVCYVVTDDSTQRTELEWMKLLKSNNKPLIVLLNIQSNLEDSRRRKHFLNNPEKLFKEDGESGLKGHLNRLRTEINKYYTDKSSDELPENNISDFPIIPVMLLAARLSRQTYDEEESKKLFRYSRIERFLSIIRASVVESGIIRRSQNLLGSTVGRLEKPQAWLSSEYENYQQLVKSLESKKIFLNREIEKAASDCLLLVKNEIDSVFGDVLSHVGSFAESNWNSAPEDIQRKWKQECLDISFQENLRNALEKAKIRFDELAEEAISQVGNELKIIAELNEANPSFSKQDIGTFFRDLFSFGQILLSIAGSVVTFFYPPVGFVLRIAGTVIGIARNFFKSREKKRREAVEKISKELSNHLKNQNIEVSKKYSADLELYFNNVLENTDGYFDTIIGSLRLICSDIKTSMEVLKKEIDMLNRAYAKRIVDTCLENYDPLVSSNIDNTIMKVERNFSVSLDIYVNPNIQIPKKSLDRVQKVIQEKINIVS